MKVLIRIGIAAAIVGVAFAFLWWRGYLNRIADYLATTREELRKCTWPTLEELKGSTTVVAISIILLSTFTVTVDYVVVKLLTFIYSS